jgi:tetratricopeptide (TPR) repeat protein
MSHSPDDARGRGVRWQAALIALATAAIYAPVLRGGWLWDDGLEITQNAAVRGAAGWRTPWFAPVGMDYLPLKSTLQWLEWHLWGDRVACYHLINLGLHITSALLVWRLLARLGLGSTAWFGGLLFGIHPLAVESVAWIAEFKNTLSLPPLLCAMTAWVDYDRSGRPAERWRALGWFIGAMLCKTSVVMLPAFLLLFACWRRRRIGWRDLRASAPFWMVSAGLGLVTVWFQTRRAIGGSVPAAGALARLARAGWSIVHYAATGLFPFRLAPIYPPIAPGWPAAGGWIIVAVVLALLWRWRTTWGRHALLGSGWFLLNLLPVLGVIPLAYLRVAPVADHLAYVSLVGLAGLGAAVLEAARGGGRRVPLAGLAVAGLVVAAFLVSGFRYAGTFRNERALWSQAVARNPSAWLARSNLGRVYLQAGDPAAALAQFSEAIRLQPDSAEAQANAGAAYEQLGRNADAEGGFREAVRLEPGLAGGHYDLGRFLLQSGRPIEASDEFRAALRLDPAMATAHNNLGLALARLSRSSEAEAEFKEALRLNPRLVEALLNLGNAAFRRGSPEEAAACYREALRIDPGYAAAHRNLGVALQELGRTREAQTEFQAAAGGFRP